MAPQTTLDSFHDLVGISYNDLDCYELTQKFYSKVFNKDLDILYDIRPDEKKTKTLFEKQKSSFDKVTIPQFGDIIVFNVATLPCHIGIYINNRLFLHTRKHTGSVLERLAQWNKRIEGYYRWQK